MVWWFKGVIMMIIYEFWLTFLWLKPLRSSYQERHRLLCSSSHIKIKWDDKNPKTQKWSTELNNHTDETLSLLLPNCIVFTVIGPCIDGGFVSSKTSFLSTPCLSPSDWNKAVNLSQVANAIILGVSTWQKSIWHKALSHWLLFMTKCASVFP